MADNLQNMRAKHANWISYWIIPSLMLLVVWMTLPDVFEGFKIFQKTERIQLHSQSNVKCERGGRAGKIGYLYNENNRIQLRSYTLCSTIEKYSDYQIKEMTLLTYPFGYPPTVVKIDFIKPAFIEGMHPVEFIDVIDQNRMREKARVHVFSVWLITLFGGFFVFKTMRAQRDQHPRR